MELKEENTANKVTNKKWKYGVLALYSAFVLLSPISVPFYEVPTIEPDSFLVDESVHALAQNFITEVVQNDIDSATARFPDQFQEEVSKALSLMVPNIEGVSLESYKITGSMTNHYPEVSKYVLTYEFDNSQNQKLKNYPIMRMQVVLHEEDGILGPEKLHYLPLDVSETTIEPYSLKEHGSMTLFAVLGYAFIIFFTYLYIRRYDKPSWWIIALMLLLTATIELSGSGFSYGLGLRVESFLSRPGLYAPILVTVPIPAGVLIAIGWLFYRSKRPKKDKPLESSENRM